MYIHLSILLPPGHSAGAAPQVAEGPEVDAADHLHIYIYIYIYREREGERSLYLSLSIYIYR